MKQVNQSNRKTGGNFNDSWGSGVKEQVKVFQNSLL